MKTDLVLASQSPSRATLLRGAGFFSFRAQPPGVDESAIKRAFPGPPGPLAEKLAEAKALAVCPACPGAAVVAADQVLAVSLPGGKWQRYDKPENMDQARAMLRALRGQTHHLHNGAVLARDGKIMWRHQSAARLTMRRFSDAFLDAYLAREGEGLLASAGAYRLEGAGAHLFEEIDGDYFTILGLPLLPLLAALREEGVVPA